MEQEVKVIQTNKLKILEDNLTFLKVLIDFKNTYFINEIEIEPFEKFSLGFSSEYWYLQYHLLKDKKISIDENFDFLFRENKINIIYLSISDLNSFNIKCNDGNWYIDILKINEVSINLLLSLQENGYS